MTRVSIPGPDIEADVSAEQVTAYLLAPERGWRQLSEEDSPGWSSFMSRVGRRFVGWSNENTSPREIEEAIHDIARAEGRHPSAVLADIVGPAVGSVGADCGSFFARKCPARMLAIVTMGYADVAKVCAREAQKESE